MYKIIEAPKFKVKCNNCETIYQYDGTCLSKIRRRYYTICPLCEYKNRHKKEYKE